MCFISCPHRDVDRGRARRTRAMAPRARDGDVDVRGGLPWTLLCASFVNFASFHAVREGYMACKPALRARDAYPAALLGEVDFGFCLAYALGLACSGLVGRRFGYRRTIATSFALTAVFACGLGAAVGYGPRTRTSDDAWRRARLAHFPWWIGSGFVQSLAYPNFVALISRNVRDARRGSVLTVWVMASPVGDIVGLSIARAVLERYGDDNWPVVMFVAAAFVVINLAIFLVFVREPKEEAVGTSGEDAESTALLGSSEDDSASFFEIARRVWTVPGVVDFCCSIMALKVVITSMLFWTPYYVDDVYPKQKKYSIVSTQLFDLALILGIGSTALMNRVFNRWIAVFLVSLAVGLAPLFALPYAHVLGWTVACIFAVGFFVGPSAALLASTMSSDLGERAEARTGMRGIVGVISGFVDSAGAVGSGVGQILVGAVAQSGGWHSVFSMLCVFVVLGMLSLTRVARMEHIELSTRASKRIDRELS